MVLKVALLDIDGTLIDSNEAHALSWKDTLTEFGLDAEWLEVRWRIGMGGDKLLPEITGIEEDSKQGKAISKRRKEIFKERYLERCKPFPKVRELLQRMKSEGLRLIVATSSGEDLLDQLLEKAGVADLIDKNTTKDDAAASKPDPDIIHAALKKAGVNPEEALMLGDTPYDIAAASAAGVKTIAFTSGGWDVDELSEAVAVYRDPADLLSHFSASLLCCKPASASDVQSETQPKGPFEEMSSTRH